MPEPIKNQGFEMVDSALLKETPSLQELRIIVSVRVLDAAAQAEEYGRRDERDAEHEGGEDADRVDVPLDHAHVLWRPVAQAEEQLGRARHVAAPEVGKHGGVMALPG